MTEEQTICRELAEAMGHSTGIGQYDYFNDWTGTGALIEWANRQKYTLKITPYAENLAECFCDHNAIPQACYETWERTQEAITRAIYSAVKASLRPSETP